MSKIEIFNESVHDKHLFKAVLMAGAPGSGKSTIVKELADVYSDSNFHFANKDNRLDKSDKVFKYGAPTYTISNENIALVNSDDIIALCLKHFSKLDNLVKLCTSSIYDQWKHTLNVI